MSGLEGVHRYEGWMTVRPVRMVCRCPAFSSSLASDRSVMPSVAKRKEPWQCAAVRRTSGATRVAAQV